MDKLYSNIRNRRVELHMTQTELAKRVGYSDKTMISRIEHGKIDLSQGMLMRFADALDTSAAKLMGWTDIDYDGGLKFFGGDFDRILSDENVNFRFSSNKRLAEINEQYFHFELDSILEKEINRRLIISAMGCTDTQKELAISTFEQFKRLKED